LQCDFCKSHEFLGLFLPLALVLGEGRNEHQFSSVDKPGRGFEAGLFASLRKRAVDLAPSIADAFQIAAEMEASEVNAIHCHLTSPTHNSVYLLRRKIPISMPDHVEYLIREGRKLGVHENTLKTLERAT
jgi:hypothetical protein